MAVLVTGATGFIGRNLVDALAANGDEVRCLVRRSPTTEARPRIHYNVADFVRADLGIGNEIFRNVDVVYHLAGLTRASTDKAFIDANVGVTTRLLDRVSAAGSPRFVYVSSQAAAGPAVDDEHPVTELDVAHPVEAYGRSKLAAEEAVRAYASRLPVTIVRPVAVYGPGDRDFLAIFRMARWRVAIYPGIRDSVVGTIYVDDLVHGLIAAAQSPRAVGNTYFMGNAHHHSWQAIYRAISAAMNRSPLVELEIPSTIIRAEAALSDLLAGVRRRAPLVTRNKAALAAQKYWVCSSERAHDDFGFTAPTSLASGVRATYDWYVSHRWM